MANPLGGLDLGKQVGPLPMGAWLAIVGGSLGVALYFRNRANADSVVYANDTSSIPGVGVGGVGAYTPIDGGTGTDTEAPPVGIQSNLQWQQAAFTYLVATGADASFVDKTLRDYLSGLQLDLQGRMLISLALAKLGVPPEILPDAPALAVPPVTKPVVAAPRPAPKPVPKPAAKPAAQRYYTVVSGDSLWKIAAKYLGSGGKWSTIYNANRGTIGGNPNIIHPGMRLLIPNS